MIEITALFTCSIEKKLHPQRYDIRRFKMYFRSMGFKTGIKILVVGAICAAFISCSLEVNYTPPAGSNQIAVNHYSFGKIVVNEKTYENDIAISDDGTVSNWRMEAQHAIQLTDVKALMGGAVKMLIIGIGANDGCSVTEEVFAYAASKSIAVHVLNTFEAVKLFNSTPKEGLTACFHVNC